MKNKSVTASIILGISIIIASLIFFTTNRYVVVGEKYIFDRFTKEATPVYKLEKQEELTKDELYRKWEKEYNLEFK